MDYVASWLGRATTSFYHAPQTLRIPLKKSASDEQEISLLDLCKETTPPCTLTPMLPNGHAQTMYAALLKRETPVNYLRKVFQSDDPRYTGQFAVDFLTRDTVKQGSGDEGLPPRTRYFHDEEWAPYEGGSDDDKPMLVVLHGLSGGSHELYLREVLQALADTPTGKSEWEMCVVMARGCGWSKITSGVLFNARATWDVRQMVKWLRAKYPKRPLFGLGFSLGGNILTDYLGEEGDRCLLTGAVVCSNPFDLSAGSINLQSTWVGREVYSKTMGTAMKRLVKKHVDAVKLNPRVNLDEVLATTYLHEFDRAIQCPSWGYPTEGCYYRDASSTEPLLAVRVPFLAVHAADDPISPKEALPFEELKKNPFAVLCLTSMGGHLGWFEVGGSRWFVKPVVNFLRKMADEVDLPALATVVAKQEDAMQSVWTEQAQFHPLRRKLELVEMN